MYLPLTMVTSTIVPGVKVHWIGESSGSPVRTVAPLRPVTLYCFVYESAEPG